MTWVPGVPNDSSFDVEEGVWAGLMRVDPGGALQRDYIARAFEVKMGASRTGGSFKVIFEDSLFNLKDHSRLTDLRQVWLGVQKGPSTDPWNGVLGRAWLMGGYIEKRYTEVLQTTRKTISFEGFDYMVLMPGLIFGTPEVPKVYEEADIGAVASDIATSLAVYGFTKATGAGFNSSTGTKITKTYDKFNKISDILKELVEKTTEKFDWYIDHLKKIYFHERGIFSSGMTLDFPSNFQSGTFVWGDSKDLLTEVWATDGEVKTSPPGTMQWTLVKKDWLVQGCDVFDSTPAVDDYFDWVLGIDAGLRMYVFSDVTQAWGIWTQCILTVGQAVKAYYPNSFFLNIDLREFTHLHFDFRKNPYRITDVYLAILGSPNPVAPSGYIYYDWTTKVAGVPDNTWTHVEIKLPEFDIEGNVVNWNGWVKVNSPDLMAIGYVGLEIYPPPGLIVSNFSFARLYLSRLSYASASSGLYSPPRIKVISEKDLQTRREAYDRASYELDLYKNPLQYLSPIADGDPRYLPGKTVTLNLIAPFLGVNRIINDVTHTINEETKYTVTLNLSEKAVRSPSPAVPFRDQSERICDLDRWLTRVAIGKQGT